MALRFFFLLPLERCFSIVVAENRSFDKDESSKQEHFVDFKEKGGGDDLNAERLVCEYAQVAAEEGKTGDEGEREYERQSRKPAASADVMQALEYDACRQDRGERTGGCCAVECDRVA